MFQRSSSVGFGACKEVEVNVFFVWQAAENRAVGLRDLREHICESRRLLLRKYPRWIRHQVMRLAIDLELRNVEVSHFGWRVEQIIVVGRGKRRVVKLLESGHDLPA